MSLAYKFNCVLAELRETRSSYAKRAGVHPAVLSRLIPKDGKERGRKSTLATLLRVIAASNGLLKVEDFRDGSIMWGNPLRIDDSCPLCGQYISENAEHLKGNHAQVRQSEARSG